MNRIILSFLFILQFSDLVNAEVLNDNYISGSKAVITKSSEEIISKVDSALVTHDSQHREKKYRLDRVDMAFGISAEAGLLFLSSEKEKSVEFIWERNKEKALPLEVSEDVSFELSPDVNENYRIISKYVFHSLSKNGKYRVQQKLVRQLYKDAKKLTSIFHAASTYQGKDGWRINRIFKNYYFSISGDLVFGNLTYDKRLRFRFKINHLYKTALPTIKEKRLHRKFSGFITHFEKLRSHDDIYSRLKLDRVWMLNTLDKSLDLKFLKVSKGRGIQFEYLYSDKGMSHYISSPNNSIGRATRDFVNLLDFQKLMTSNFDLAQIRLSGGITKEFNFVFGAISSSKTIEYHYRQ
jgi:hypothetical protein